MQGVQAVKPIKINSDVDIKYLGPEEAFYILNQQKNQRGKGKNRALHANEIMDVIVLPVGETHPIGTYYSNLTKQLFTWYWNSDGNHFITRTTGDLLEVIYQGPMPISMHPKHAMSQFRAYLVHHEEETGEHCIKGDYLVWTTGYGFICYLDVELSLLTDSFNLQYFQDCVENPLDYISLEVRQPQKCITATIKNDINVLRQNMILSRPWQWRYKYVYYDGRESEWSPISSLYWVDTPEFARDGRFARCWDLTIPSGNGYVVEIVLAFRNDNGGTWLEYDRIKKFGNYKGQSGYYYGYGGGAIGGGFDECWYTRDIVLPNYDPQECNFVYEFCGDKECVPVAPEETNRLFNPIPFNTQCLLPIDNRLAFFNGMLGSEKMEKLDLDKVRFEVENSANCKRETVTIKFSAFCYDARQNIPAFIWRRGGTLSKQPDDPDDGAFFGGIKAFPSIFDPIPDILLLWDLQTVDSQRFFDPDRRNFTAYVAGTQFDCVMKQYKLNGDGTMEEWGTVTGMGKAMQRNSVMSRHPPKFIQIGEIEVPKGTRGWIRIAGLNGEQDESTTVAGIVQLPPNYDFDINESGVNKLKSTRDKFVPKEIWFDTCGATGPVLDLTHQSFCIMDVATFKWNGLGYVVDNNTLPVPGAYVQEENGILEQHVEFKVDSDHNGFYFYAGNESRRSISIQVEQDCAGDFQNVHLIRKSEGGNDSRIDVVIDDDEYADDKFMHKLTFKMEDCTGQPITGVSIAVSNHRAIKTGADGIARITVRNTSSRNRRVKIAVMQNQGQFFRDCNDNCNPCMYTTEVATPVCYDPVTTTDLGSTQVKAFGINNRGLKSGAMYEWAFALIGHGRRSFAQVNNYFTAIPSIQEKQNYSLNEVSVSINSRLNFEPWVEKVVLLRTKNLRYNDYLQWVVDEIEPIDSDGKPSSMFSATQLKLTIQSLNDYNAAYFFKTNTIYQYVAGDRVEFITNGDGIIFTKMINLAIKSPFLKKELLEKDAEPPVEFFNQILIDNDPLLFNLKEGALIELQKLNVCEVKDRFQEICSPIPVNDFIGTFKVNTFDTYVQNRAIPDLTTVFSFEHHSITDFWGNHVDDQGRLTSENPFEKEQRFGRNMWITDVWNFTGSFNGVHRFSDEQVKRFTGIEMGDIISATIRNARRLLIVCEHDNFTATIGDDIPRVGADGVLKVTPGNQLVTDPQDKAGGNYGCHYNDVGSIFFGDGYATWIDGHHAKPGFIAHDYQNATDVSYMQIQDWLIRIVTRARAHNEKAAETDMFRYCTGYDPISETVPLTIRRPGSPGINNAHQPDGDNQTIQYDPLTKDFPSYASYTPECYGELSVHGTDIHTFVSIFRCQHYLHSESNPLRNTFYGAACDRVIGFALNDNPTKEKKALALEVQATMRYFAESITTDKDSFISLIPPKRWKNKLNKWNAEFLRNQNSRGGLYAGDSTQGTAIAITLVRDNTVNLEWQTIDPAKQSADDESDIILIRYNFLESTGMTAK